MNEETAVAIVAEVLALECGVHSALAKQIYISAALHDVGKCKIDSAILYKPGKLTEKEFEIMKTHTTHGAELLSCIKGNLGDMARNISKFHHEKYDGTGYWNKYTCELPLYVSIISVADVFVALLSTRCYKPAWSFEQTIEYINQQSGKHFNPRLAEVFIHLARHDGRMKAVCTSLASVS